MSAIKELLYAFEAGDMIRMDETITDDFDLRIEHYGDPEANVSWQRSSDRTGFHALLARLSQEVFPRGTRILSLDTRILGNGWTLTGFRQQFFYLPRGGEVIGETWILAHESEGKLDFFREIATPVRDAEA